MKRLLVATALLLGFAAHAQQQIEPNPLNTRATLKKHYVVMISLDGFRYDYIREHGAPHLAEMAKEGASAPDGMRPSYPSITFPNHYTLVTGLRPEHHGLVNGNFYAPDLDKTYLYKTYNNNGDFYGGVPLWSLAEKQGMRSAVMFWPGSEAKIAGYRPTWWNKFDDKYDDEKRIDQVIAWLALPAAERPHYIAMYFSNVDHAGHTYGPDTPEVKAAVHHVDALMGELRERLKKTGLPVDVVIVADHGMIQHQGDYITLTDLPGMAAVLHGVRHEATMLYPANETQAAAIYDAFRAHPDPRFTVYRRAELPKHLLYGDNPRTGDPVIVPNGPYLFQFDHPEEEKKPNIGEHGYDVDRMPEMKAVFLAAGPDVRADVKLPTFDNVDVYDFVAKMLRLKPAKNDGSLAPLRSALKN